MAAGYRIKTWRHWEVMEQKLPGEWDAVYPERGTIDDAVNAWLSADNVEPARVGYSCMPVGVNKETGRTTYLHTLVVTYIPQEHIHDVRNQVQVVKAHVETSQEAGEPVAGDFQSSVDFAERPPDDGIRIDGPADLNRVASILNIPAAEVHRAFAEINSVASGVQVPHSHGGRPVPDGPHGSEHPGGGNPLSRTIGRQP